MTRFATLTAAALAVLAVGVAGCGSSKKSSSSSTPSSSSTTATQPASSKPAAGGITVDMKNTKFVPKTITAKVGQKITWVNKDPIAHTATATSGGTFDSGNLGPGKKFSFTPSKPGTIQYWCTIHKQVQTGTIKVVK